MTAGDALLSVRDLRVYFGSPDRPVRAVDGVSFDVPAGQVLALVGESGCGKSVTALALARLVPQPPAFYAGGEVFFRGRPVRSMPERELRALRGGGISYIFQEPATSLNPVFTVGWQVREAIRLHRRGEDARAVALENLRRVGLPEPERLLRAYPHELSGGMQQRVMIAMALATRPAMIVADEPTTALDVTIQAQILELLAELVQSQGMAGLLITHNLGLVADYARRVHVMYAGRIVEAGAVREVLVCPAHPYTRGLLDAVPRLHGTGGRLQGIPGNVPHPAHVPPGCPFHPRCPRAQARCRHDVPEITEPLPDRRVRCHFPLAHAAAPRRDTNETTGAHHG